MYRRLFDVLTGKDTRRTFAGLSADESGTRVRAALLPFLVAANGMSLLALAAIGAIGPMHLWATVILLPAVAAGFLAGPPISRVLDARYLRAAILVFSVASGLVLIVKG